MEKEMVMHPSHYNTNGRKECWDEMKEIFGDEAVAIFDVLSAYKYYYRKGEKDGNPKDQDIAKINNYMAHCADLLASTCARTPQAKKCYVKMKEVLANEN